MQQVIGLELVQVGWKKNENGQFKMRQIPGTEEKLEAELVLLSMGFVHPVQEGIIEDLKLKVNARKNIVTNNEFLTSSKKVFAAGDARNGASLVVTAIYSGREAAASIIDFLGTS